MRRLTPPRGSRPLTARAAPPALKLIGSAALAVALCACPPARPPAARAEEVGAADAAGAAGAAGAEVSALNPPCGVSASGAALPRVGLRLHLSPRPGAPEGGGEDSSWLRAQLAEAARLFAPVGVCFEVTALLTRPAADGEVLTRAHRTALGRPEEGGVALARGEVDVFVVNRLGDVDAPGQEIRGVHWRDPLAPERRRWVLLSRIAQPLVLAHELGHYFSLPHSTEPMSIMNKTPRAQPPVSARGFTPGEYARMRRAWGRMRAGGQLRGR